MSKNILKDRPKGVVIVAHSLLSHLLRGQIATNRLPIDEIFEQDPHDFGVLVNKGMPNEKFFDGWHPDIVLIVNFISFDPLSKFLQGDLHLIFFDDILYLLKIILDFVLQASEEHS